MTSIHTRLFVLLMALTGVVWLFAATWIYFGTRAKVEHVLDRRLVEAASMVDSLVANRTIDARQPELTLSPRMSTVGYEHQLSCQIWSLDGLLVGKSKNAPSKALSPAQSGFSESDINGETWRSYAVVDKTTGTRILVGDNVNVRSRLIADVMKGLIIPGLGVVPLMAVLLWISLSRGLAPLRFAADEIGARDANDLRPLAVETGPRELQPIIGALNSLLSRVSAARNREKNFTAFAAHELKTPLAGLKTQAQLALVLQETTSRDHALSQIIFSVDRTSRLVRQLLDIAMIESRESAVEPGPTDAGHLLRMVVDDLAPSLRETARIEIDATVDGLMVKTLPDFFILAARNLIENAVLHSPKSGSVRCFASIGNDVAVVKIEDDGPGVPTHELAHLTERFFRGRSKAGVGSGLGLSIVDMALRSSRSTLQLGNRPNGGFSAAMTIPLALEVIMPMSGCSTASSCPEVQTQEDAVDVAKARRASV